MLGMSGDVVVAGAVVESTDQRRPIVALLLDEHGWCGTDRVLVKGFSCWPRSDFSFRLEVPPTTSRLGTPTRSSSHRPRGTEKTYFALWTARPAHASRLPQ